MTTPAKKKATPKKIVAFRITPELAKDIEDAATVSGQTQTDFVVAAIEARITPKIKAKMETLRQLRSK